MMKKMSFWGVVLLAVLAAGICCNGQETVWYRPLELSGKGVVQTDLFAVRGSKWRMRFYLSGNSLGHLLLLGVNPEDQLQLVSVPQSSRSRKQTRGLMNWKREQMPSLAYVRVEVPNEEEWSFSVEQFVSDVDRWELLQLSKKSPNLLRFGEWTGEADEEKTVEFQIPSSHWRITASALELLGEVRVCLVEKKSGKVIFRTKITGGRSCEGWCHDKGEYLLRWKGIRTGSHIVIEAD